MASLRRASKRRSRKCDFLEKSGSCADTLMSSRNRKPSSPYGSQLVSPPASSGCTIPSSSPDVENYNHDVSEDPMKDKEDEEEEEEEEEQELKQGYPKRMVPSSVSKTEPSTSPPPQILRRVGFEPSLDPLSLLEKVKLLKICCDHGSQFLHCPTSGKHAEEDAWTSIMEKFSTTVRLGFFTKYSDVKKVASKICRNRRKNTKGNVPPQRRPRMGDLDTWIDRWVRIWKCRDLVVNIANAHQSMRETIGEKKFKRIFRHRMDGNELPQDLGGLTLSPPLWKAIQKRIRIEERSLGARHISLFPGQDDSDWSDEDETDEDALPEADDEGLPIQSIEQESQISSSDTPEVIGSTPHREVEGKLDFPGPSPRTQARLDQFERGYTTILKEEQGRTGKQTTILDLANKKQERERPPSTSTSNSEEASEAGVVQWELEEKGLTNPTTRLLASSSDKIEDKKLDDSTSLSIGRSTPPPGEVDVQRNTSTNPTRSQRLKPGTYCHGEEVLVGFHGRQAILAGMNDTVAQDYRQGVCAKIDISGRVRLRLRAQNMRGEQVPDEFCLNGARVYPKDVIYLPKFHGMSYNEVRQEVARQSLLPVNQRIFHDWIPTTVAEDYDREDDLSMLVTSSRGRSLFRGVDTDNDPADKSWNTSSEEVEKNQMAATSGSQGSDPRTSSYNVRKDLRPAHNVYVPVETRRFALSELPAGYSGKTTAGQSDLSNHKPQETNPDRIGTPEVLRKFLADEARKQQKPSAPHGIPHHSSPPRKLNPRGRTSNKNRITPSRFYGVESLEHNIVEDGQQIPEPHEEPIVLGQLRSGSNSNVDSSQRQTTSNHRTPNASLAQDYSDNDSLPDVEELHRRRVRVAKGPVSPQHAKRRWDFRDPNISVADEEVGALASSHPQDTSCTSLQMDGPLCHPENTSMSGGTIESSQNLANDEPGGQENTAITPSGSCSKKRTRCQSMTNSSSSSSSNSCTSSFNVLTVPQALNSTTSTRNEHSAKRPRPPPPSEHVQTPVPIPNLTNNGLKPFWRPGTEAIARNNSATDKEHGRMGVRPLDKGKGKATQPHAQNKPSMYPQSSNGKSYAPKWKTDARDTAPSHRFYPYGQPGSSTGPATSQNRRKNGGGGKRDHYRGKDRYNRTSGGNYRNRFLREVTTDTVDFENFSLDRKCDFLRRKMSRMEEMLRKIEKD